MIGIVFPAIGRLRGLRSRVLRNESGQGLIEYALIIGIVSIGAVVALGFFSGRITGLFSKTGNSLNNATLAQGAGGPGGGGTPFTPPSGAAAPGCGSNCHYVAGGDVSGGPPSVGSPNGVYADNTPPGAHTGDPCSFDFNGDGVIDFSGVWINEADIPNGQDWDVDPPGSGNSYTADWACIQGSVPTSPPSGNVNLDCPGSSCNDGEVATADTGTWSGYPAPVLTYQWSVNTSSSASCSTSSGWTNLGTGSTQTLPAHGGSSDTIRVIVTGTNSAPGSPHTACDTATFSTSPPSGNVNIDCPGSSCNDHEVASADTGTWNGSPTPVLTYQWSVNTSSSASCSTSSGWTNLGTGSTQTLPTHGGSSDTIRVIVTGTNSDPGSPGTACDTRTFS